MASKITYFPNPLPDEIFFSILARYHVFSGNQDSKKTLCSLMGSLSYIPKTCLPSRLDLFCRQIADIWNISVAEIIENHTTLPYYRPFFKSKLDELERGIRGIDGRGIKMTLGLPASRLGAAEPLRYCLKCVKEDLGKFGQPYWHRAHQLPGVIVCAKHHKWLFSLPYALEQRHRHALLLPPYKAAKNKKPSEWCFAKEHVKELLFDISVLSQDLLNLGLPGIFLEELHYTYLGTLQKMDMATSSGHIRQKNLHNEFQNHFRDLLLLPEYSNLKLSDDHTDWLAALVRKPRANKHPLKHLLLIKFLYNNLDEFLIHFGKEQKVSNTELTTNSKKEDTWAKELFTLLVRQHQSMREVARRKGKSVTTIRIEAERQGIEINRRRKIISEETEKQIIVTLDSRKSIKMIAGVYGISTISVSRILRSHTELQNKRIMRIFEYNRRGNRVALLRVRRDSPEYSRKQLCGIISSAYHWLYIHDRQWLYEHLPEKLNQARLNRTQSVDWKLRDENIAKAIQIAAFRLLTQTNKPIRLTITELGRRVGALTNIQKHPNKLPRTIAMLNRVAESTEAFQIRRVVWAANKLEQGKFEVVDWQIRRLAGLSGNIHPLVEAAIRSVLCTSTRHGELLGRENLHGASNN